jgi:hypothetical protein
VNAADRQMITRLADVTAQFVQPPRPYVSRDTMPNREFINAYDKAEKDFAELQRDRAVIAAAHLAYLNDTEGFAGRIDLEQKIRTITGSMAEELAKPLPYPVKAEVPA